MRSYQDQKQIALNILHETAVIAASRGIPDLSDDLGREEQHLRSGELNVVICGECKRGKSSLINAFLDEPDLCPVDAPVATNAITVIRWANTEKILVHLDDGSGGDGPATVTEEITRERLRDYVTEQGNEGNRRRVKLVEIGLPGEKLRDGLVLIDTPGVGTLNAEHTAATYGIIPYADSVLFVSAANEPLSEPELAFCQRIARHTPHLLHVLTKRDAVGNAAEILRDNVHKLSIALGRPEDELPAVAVSSRLKADYLDDPDDETLHASGFPQLEEGVWRLLERRTSILLSRARGRVVPAIAQLRLPIKTERDGLEATSDAELAGMSAELQAKIARAEYLLSEQTFWIGELNRKLALLQNHTTAWLEGEFRAIHANLDRYLDRDEYLLDPAQLAAMLTADCNGSFAIVITNIEGELAQIATAMSRETSLDVKASARGASGPAAITVSPSEPQGISNLQKGVEIGRSTTMSSMGLGMTGAVIGGGLGAILGTIVAPGFGTVGGAVIGAKVVGTVASVVGGIFGWRRGSMDVRERERKARRNALETECRKRLAEARTAIAHELTDLLTNAGSDIRNTLLRAIVVEQKACRTAAERLEIAAKTRRTDTSKRLVELGNALTMLQRLESAADALVEERLDEEQ